jgi:glycosyltransferase involved in cell wall biosynthesis
MHILFLSISSAVSNIHNRGIYPDLMRYFAKQGHEVYIVCPFERRTKTKTNLQEHDRVHILGVKTLNITKSNVIEKGLATLLIQHQFSTAINTYFRGVKFDLILYSTPPITFNKLIESLKKKYGAFTFLMLKDIFPQNAIDLQMMQKGLLYQFFRKKEEKLYQLSDFIGCMSPANVQYVIQNNPYLNQHKIGLCPNAIEVKNRTINNKNEVLKKYGIPKDATLFLYGGNLGLPQGLHHLIDVFNVVKNNHKAYFLVVGGGSHAYLIENWIKQHSPQNIQYRKMMERSEYDELEACFDVGMIFLDPRFTIPNFPSRMLSYLECKMPLLIASDPNTDIGAIAEHHHFGKKALSHDVSNIIQHINKFIENKEERKMMGENGYQFLLNNYHVSTAYEAIISAIKIKK